MSFKDVTPEDLDGLPVSDSDRWNLYKRRCSESGADALAWPEWILAGQPVPEPR